MSKVIAKVQPYILFFLFSLSQSTESTYSTGLPSIVAELHISPNLAQLSSSIYFYGFALGILILGKVSDRYGRKPVVLLGLSIFLIATLSSFFINDPLILISFRFFQAFGASVGSVVAQAMARDSYGGKELSSVYALLAMGLAVVPAFASVIGSNIVKYLGWRYIFIYLFLIIFVVFIICIFRLKETNPNGQDNNGIGYIEILGVIIRDKKVLSLGAIIGIFNGIMYSFYIEAPFIFMKKLSIDPSYYGVIVSFLAFSAMIGGFTSKKFQKRCDDGNIIMGIGLIISHISCAIFFLMSILWYFALIEEIFIKWTLIIPMMFQAFSYSFIMPIILRFSLEDYTKVNGTAGSIFGTYYYVIIATINFTTSRLHSDSIMPISFFFLALSCLTHFLLSNAKNSVSNNNKPYKALI